MTSDPGLPAQPALQLSPAPLPLPSGAYRLQTSPLRGYAHRGSLAHFHTMKLGDALTLCAEPANPHDKYAVRVHHLGQHIGYLPQGGNQVASRLLRQNAPLRAVIAWLDSGPDLQLPLTLHVLCDGPARSA